MTTRKEEVVISGIGGVFPESNNVEELKELLFSKANGVTFNSSRWNQSDPGVVAGIGKLKHIDKFDATFFSVHPNLCDVMDVITRIVLERSIEAIIDAGLSPADLYGTNTGVFMGSAFSESEILGWSSSNTSFSMLGLSRTMQANRLSYILNLTGPSYAMDGGWICGSNGLEKAKRMIEEGTISSAIVGVTNLILRPEGLYQFQGLNRLNWNAQTKSFSSDADGYNRSEACIVLFLQKESEAKRSYGTLINVQSMQFGDQPGHITEHNGNHFKSLLLNSYRESNIDPASVEFIEANGSGIKSEDTMELNIMDEVFCTGQRKTPLKVGSVKSNLGHCEASSLFVSIVKAIIALDSGYIPPNINYTEPNENVPALKSHKIQVITEKTIFNGDIIGVSSFGIHNAFSHVILRRNKKIKNHSKDMQIECKISRIVFVSGRNEENVRQCMVKIKSNGNDDEYISLINDVFSRNMNAHFYRSFSILPNLDEARLDDIWNVNPKKRPVWYIFSGMGSQWHGMGLHLMKLPIFSDIIDKCDSILKPRGIDIKNILTSQDPKLFDNVLNSFVGIAAIQIGLVEVLKALEITPDGILGHSVGELGCAFADGCFTLEETILSAYARGRASVETEFIPGRMAAIGLGYHHIKDILPHDIDVACRNSATSCTISGPVESINAFVSELSSQGTFAKAVDTGGIAYHSRYIQLAGPTLLRYLKEVIRKPKLRSSKWICSSLLETEWNSDLAKFSSAEYHTNNLLSCVLFEDSLKHIPSDAITIEIAPHGLLQAIVKSALPDTVTNIPLTKRVYGDSVRFLLTAIGKMYTSGLNPKIQELYPKITYPVSRGTPSIQNLPIWNHVEQWTPMICKASYLQNSSAERKTSILLNDNLHLIEYRFLGHYIVPFSYVLVSVWKMFIEMNNKTFCQESIQFHNLQFKNNIKIHPTISSESNLMIQCGSGHFEYILNNELIFSGEIGFFHNDLRNISEKSSVILNKTIQGYVSKKEIYTFFEDSGFDFGDNFKNISYFNVYKNNVQGCVIWKNDWIYFLDGLLKFPILENLDTCHTETPVSIRQIIIEPLVFNKRTKKDVLVNFNSVTKEITCAGIKISNIKTCPVKLTKINSLITQIEENIFIKFNDTKCKTMKDFIYNSLDVIMEENKLNFNSDKIKLTFCNPYHYDDPIFKECTKMTKQIIEKQQSIDSLMLNWDNVKNVSEDYEFGRFVTVTDENYLQDTIKTLENIKHSYVIVCSKQKIQEFKDWKVIIHQKFDDNSYLVLMKKKIIMNEKNTIFIKPTDDDYDLSIWTSLQKHNSSKEMIYIVSHDEPLEGVKNYVKNIFRKYKSKKLRFLFIFDSNAPDFELNKSFYINQLSIGLIVNILKKDGWGTYRRIVTQNVNGNNPVKNSALKIISTNRNNKLIIKYLGLNFKDLVVENDTENEYGPLEYSGLNENNKMVMGITSFQQMSPRINYNSLFMWPVPSTWSLEDATTVPLSYAMSYYVFKVLCSLDKDKSILITSGLHPIGQAAISISLAEKYEVYAIVDSSHEADQLSTIFPEFPCKRILLSTKNQIDIKLRTMTKGKGIDIIFNFLSGQAFEAAFSALADHGKFFNFSKSDMKTHRNLGTRQFLRDTSFFAVGSDVLLNESDGNKLIIQQAIMGGLAKGIIKPFRSRVLTAPFTSGKTFDAMRTAYESTISEKVVLPLNDDFKNSNSQDYVESDMYYCNPDLVYILVDRKSSWLDLAEWLVNRGARKLLIIVKRCLMSSITCRRFDRLISRNVSIQIESGSHLQTREESPDWLYQSLSSNVLGSVFIINQFDDAILSNLRYSFEEYKKKTEVSSFICISSKGERICNEMKSNGLNALNISWEGMSSNTKSTSKILPSLDLLLQKSNSIRSSSVVCSEKRENIMQWQQEMDDVISNFFPESIDELYLMNDKYANEACFIEVQTRSPRFSQLKSVTPVFVIPGFKPKLMEIFYKQLFYPSFEAYLPENISSIDEISEILVKKLKNISNQDYVSLIGESWGGIVALKMAQILESQGTMVTVSLIEGDPEILTGWSESFLSNNRFTKKLTTLYNSFSREFPKYALQNIYEELLSQNMSAYQRVLDNCTQRALTSFCSKLKALIESKPLSNKLRTKVLIFRYERKTEFNVINLKDYCVHPPIVHIIGNIDYDYKRMMVDKKMIKAISQNVAHSSPTGVELTLDDKYKHFFFFVKK